MVKIKTNKIISYEDKLSFILRGSQRLKIIMILDGKKTPSQIRKLTHLSLNNVSDILRLLVKVKIVKCLNEETVTGRLYQLTEVGNKIKKDVSESIQIENP